MNDALFEPIPAERRDSVRLALATTFAGKPITQVQQLFGGASALVYRVAVAGQPYVLRLDTRSAIRDPARNYVCMQAAADAGIAPRVHHADGGTCIAIMDFVAQRPLSEYPGGHEDLVRGLGKLSARLHALPSPPTANNPLTYLALIERMLAHLRSCGMFASGLLDPHMESFERIHKAYPWNNSALVFSHNDPNPRNILFDGERLWLIDWETSFRNDPVTDIAILANNFAPTPALEDILLQAWLGHEPDRVMRARLALMRPVTLLYYACIVLIVFARIQRSAPDTDLKAPSEAEFGRALTEGRLQAGTPEMMYVFGKLLLASYLAGVQAPGFDEALVVAAT